MSQEQDAKRTYTLDFDYSPRLTPEILGWRKYSKSVTAIGELVANGFDADATLVEVEVERNELGCPTSVIICDNGTGMTRSDLESRFCIVGVEPLSKAGPGCFSRLGVGRFAAHRIGTLSRWASVSENQDGSRVRISFTLGASDGGKLKVTEESVSDATPKGTAVEIVNLRDQDPEALNPAAISAELQSEFCSYLLGNPDRRISVEGEMLDVNGLVESREVETIPESEKIPEEATLQHLMLTHSIERSRFPAPLLFCGRGRTVATAELEQTPSPSYLGLVECAYLDTVVAANREALIEMDEGFTSLRAAAIERVGQFRLRYREQMRRQFIERARQQDFYPFRTAPADPIASVRRDVYDVVLEKVNESVNLEAMTKKQQAVIFRLLERSLDNEDLLQVLQQLLDLSDEEMETFRRVLEHTTLGSIIRLTSEVTARLSFLDVLHELVYGDVAKHLKERSQLHKILEPHCWLFGQQFHMASSDRSFRTVIRKHRKLAGLTDIDEAGLDEISGIDDIPDLFLCATRDYVPDPKHHHALVEIKSPSVSLGSKERDQVRRYAQTILDSHEFDKTSTRWDVFLVSAKATKEIERDRTQKARPHGLLWEWDNMTVWAFEWSELITRAKEEMHLVREHLQRKSQELSISEYLRENFPDVLGQSSDQVDG